MQKSTGEADLIEVIDWHKERRILVIGSYGHPRPVECVHWLQTLPNVADYDALVLNLPALTDDVFRQLGEPTPDKWLVHKLLESKGMIIAVGAHPRTMLGYVDANYQWCPIDLSFVKEQGETLEVHSPRFANYMACVKKWKFYLSTEASLIFLQDRYQRDPREESIFWTAHPIAVNRYGGMVASMIYYGLQTSANWPGTEPEVKFVSGPIFLLPPPTEVTPREAIDILLRDLFGIGIREPEPEWAARLKVPEQEAIEKKIKEAQDIVEAEQSKIDDASTELANRRKLVELLYQKGERLEDLVLDALEGLGATVRRNPIKNEEDGWIATPFGEGVLEITSSKGSASLDDVRQLDDWTFRGKEKGKEYKPILIGNYYCETPMPQRLNEKPFPPNVIEEAVKRDQCLLTTQQLFEAHCAVQEGTDGEAFLQRIMTTVGPCTLVEKPKWSV